MIAPGVRHWLALAAERAGLLPASARLLAFSERQRDAFGLADILGRPALLRAAAARIRAALGDSSVADLWAEGAALDAATAIAQGLALTVELLAHVSQGLGSLDTP